MYRISANSFFFNLTLCTMTKGAENIQGRKLFKGGNYLGNYGLFPQIKGSNLIRISNFESLRNIPKYNHYFF